MDRAADQLNTGNVAGIGLASVSKQGTVGGSLAEHVVRFGGGRLEGIGSSGATGSAGALHISKVEGEGRGATVERKRLLWSGRLELWSTYKNTLFCVCILNDTQFDILLELKINQKLN